jgi:hypothetical protein
MFDIAQTLHCGNDKDRGCAGRAAGKTGVSSFENTTQNNDLLAFHQS